MVFRYCNLTNHNQNMSNVVRKRKANVEETLCKRPSKKGPKRTETITKADISPEWGALDTQPMCSQHIDHILQKENEKLHSQECGETDEEQSDEEMERIDRKIDYLEAKFPTFCKITTHCDQEAMLFRFQLVETMDEELIKLLFLDRGKHHEKRVEYYLKRLDPLWIWQVANSRPSIEEAQKFAQEILSFEDSGTWARIAVKLIGTM